MKAIEPRPAGARQLESEGFRLHPDPAETRVKGRVAVNMEGPCHFYPVIPAKAGIHFSRAWERLCPARFAWRRAPATDLRSALAGGTPASEGRAVPRTPFPRKWPRGVKSAEMPLEPTPNRRTTLSPWGKKFLDPRSLLPVSIAYEQRAGLGRAAACGASAPPAVGAGSGAGGWITTPRGNRQANRLPQPGSLSISSAPS